MSKLYYFFIFSLIIITLFSSYNGNTTLVFMNMIILLVLLLLRYWNKHIFDKLTVDASFLPAKVYPGQQVIYQLVIENRKFLPILSLRVREDNSSEIDFVNKQFTHKYIIGESCFQDMFNLRWYQKVKKRYQIKSGDRGLYLLKDMTLSHYDFLGLYTNNKKIDEQRILTVYPRLIPLQLPETAYSQLFGTNMSEGWIFEDELNKIGVRPYHQTDNFKQINWKTSARHLQLESNIYKPSFDRETHIFLGNSLKLQTSSTKVINRLEIAIICAASLVNECIKANYKVGFYTNYVNKKKKGNGYSIVRSSKSPEQLEQILTTMARLGYSAISKLSKILKIELEAIPHGSTIILISLEIDEEVEKLLDYYKKFYKIIFIQVGGDREITTGLNKYYLAAEEDWHEIKKISLYN